LVHLILLNLSKGRDGRATGWLGAAPDALEPRAFSGSANEGGGDFEYEGTIDIQEGHVVLDIVSKADKKRSRVRTTHVELSEEGPAKISNSYQ
jgi:hypothetical protein